MRPLDPGAASLQAGPPRPALAFQLGVTGHRNLPHADTAGLQTAAAELFRAIATEVRRIHATDQASGAPLFQPTPPALRCLCGIAAGADSILAEAALAEGWDLVAALPFAPDEFARDFPAGPALDRYRALLARAARVCALDGSRQRGGEPYAEIGRQIVEQSDAILTIWDRLPPRGPGGTGDVVQQALDRTLPVAILPPSGPATLQWLGEAAAGTGDIPTLVRAALLPADDGGFPQVYFADRPSGGGLARAAMRWFEGAVLLGATPATTAVATAPAAPGGGVVASEARLLPYFTAADRLATDYAARFRAAGLMRYGLILPATFGCFIGFFGPPWLRPTGFLLQFAALVAVVAFSGRGPWERWHRRFLAYRALAEYLRNARLLAPLGAVARPPVAYPPTAAHPAPPADWTAWYGRAVVREAGLPAGWLDPAAAAAAARFVRAEAAGQVAYLLARATRFTALAARLRWIGVALFMSGIGLAAFRAGLMLAGAGDRTMLMVGEIDLILPSFAPVFLGLLGFGEYSRLAVRYRAVAADLQTQIAALDQAPAGRDAVLRVARRIADVMLAEAADWQLLIKARTMSAY